MTELLLSEVAVAALGDDPLESVGGKVEELRSDFRF